MILPRMWLQCLRRRNPRNHYQKSINMIIAFRVYYELLKIMVNFYAQVLNLEVPALYLSYENSTYLFNVPECFQRFSAEQQIKLREGCRIFLTQFEISHMSGLIGMLLTLHAEDVKNITVKGPEGLVDFIRVTRECDIGGVNLDTFSFSEYCNENQKKVCIEDPLQITCLQLVKSTCFHIQTAAQKGKINQEKITHLSKQQLQSLYKDQEINLQGTLYHIDDLREPDTPPQELWILDSIQELEFSLIQVNKNVKYIFYLKDNGLPQQQFIDSLPHVDHILCYKQKVNFRCQYVLNKLSEKYPKNFSKCDYQSQPIEQFVIFPLQKQGRRVQNYAHSEIRELNHPYEYEGDTTQQRITFLGTASMKPNKYRNVSSILITDENQTILLDCGEGTYKQLLDESHEFNDTLIWISHIHSDHNLGLLSLMRMENIHILIPANMENWINECIRLFKLKVNVVMINQAQILDLQKSFNISLQFCPVYHCEQAYGIRIDFQNGKSISYSGDTRPSFEFIKMSLNVNVMIHEATFTDDMLENAIKTKHSIIREAVESAILSKSKTLILTHFSQRYTKGGQREIQDVKSLISNEEYQNYLQYWTVFALDHLGGFIDEYQNMVKFSQYLQNIFI